MWLWPRRWAFLMCSQDWDPWSRPSSASHAYELRSATKTSSPTTQVTQWLGVSTEVSEVRRQTPQAHNPSNGDLFRLSKAVKKGIPNLYSLVICPKVRGKLSDPGATFRHLQTSLACRSLPPQAGQDQVLWLLHGMQPRGLSHLPSSVSLSQLQPKRSR